MGEHERPETDRASGEYPPPETISSADLLEVRAEHRLARELMIACGIPDPTPDAIDQLLEAFLPALRKMCDAAHPWDPKGGTWRESGSMGALTDARKKFKRWWYRAWVMLRPHDDPAAVDSAVDLLNFIGFWLRSEDNSWNDWEEPGSGRV